MDVANAAAAADGEGVKEEAEDGIRRVFLTAEDIGKMVPEYGEHVERVVMEKGRQHPLVKTQYFNEEIDVQAGMFNEMRMGMMLGDRPGQEAPVMGHMYAFCVDVGGDGTLSLRDHGLTRQMRRMRR